MKTEVLLNTGVKVGTDEVVEKTQAEKDAEALQNAGVGKPAVNPNNIGETDENGDDAFTRELRRRFEAGETITKEDIVRPQGFARASDTRFITNTAEDEELFNQLSGKVGQRIVSYTKNDDGTYNCVGLDQSTYSKISI